MSKNTHFTGQPIYSQLLKFTNKEKIKKISKQSGHERYVKKLDGYTHFVSLLFGVLQRYDSLRELIIGLLSEANKLQHLGINYVARRSTIAEANNRRSSDFFQQIYADLYRTYRSTLADSRTSKFWEEHLFIMDSTTITLFSSILKGAGRNPKHGKKKGGIKVHSVIKATENVPYLTRFTSAATHDHFLMKEVSLPSGSFITFDRAYINYSEFERLTNQNIFYVTKMKKNLTYKIETDKMTVHPDGKVRYRDCMITFEKTNKNTEEQLIKHKSRKLEYWIEDEKGKLKTATLLTNNFDLEASEIVEIYDKRWQIELLFKQLKQNFPLKYFYGDSVNAIKTQIWITLIANLLLTLVKKQVRHKWAFSNLVTAIRQMLMYYIDMYKYLENPEKSLQILEEERAKSPPVIDLFNQSSA